MQQCDKQDVSFDHVVLASGSAGTHAGMAVGLRASGSELPILGIGVNVPRDEQEAKVFDLACATAEYIDRPGCVSRQDIVADCNYIGAGYGEPTSSMDSESRAQAFRMIKLLKDEGVSIIVATHEYHTLAHLCDEHLLLQAGRLQPQPTGPAGGERKIIPYG